MIKHFILFTILNAVDVYLTNLFVLQNPDSFSESNPIGNAFIKMSGLSGLVIMKISIVFLIILPALIMINKRKPSVALRTMKFANFIMLFLFSYEIWILIYRY